MTGGMIVEQTKEGRLWSLDALRGFDMLFITGLSALVVRVCKLCGSPECWLVKQMSHVRWDGFAHHDTIFPLFLFIAGISFPFSLAKQRDNGSSETKITLRIIRRGLVLFLLGMVYNGMLDFNFARLRIFSVLGRIGLAWMFAALIWTRVKKIWPRIAVTLLILAGYWALTRFFAAPDHPNASPFTVEGNICCWFDRTFFPNHIYNAKYDPEGLLSAIPAIATALLGMFTGALVRNRQSGLSGGKKTLFMFGAALVFGVVAVVWGRWYPINKALWSSTFVLAAASYSLAMFALFYWIIDVLELRKWTLYFRVIGMNSITIYMASRFIDFERANRFFFRGVIGLFPKTATEVVSTVGYMAVVWLFLYFLYRHKIFFKV